MDQPVTLITHIAWGQMMVLVDGQPYPFKDCKVWPGGAMAWDWTITGTHHRPGIQPADIAEILEHNIEVMILSRGMQLALHTCTQTEEVLRSRGIEYHIEETGRAVALYNKLAQSGKRVGGIFHSTC